MAKVLFVWNTSPAIRGEDVVDPPTHKEEDKTWFERSDFMSCDTLTKLSLKCGNRDSALNSEGKKTGARSYSSEQFVKKIYE